MEYWSHKRIKTRIGIFGIKYEHVITSFISKAVETNTPTT